MNESYYPLAIHWLKSMGFDTKKGNIDDILFNQEQSFYEKNNKNPFEYEILLNQYIYEIENATNQHNPIKKITIVSGKHKNGEKEGYERLDFYPGEITAVVGPTGSGKSRLLEDIEFGANGNTPTSRRVLFNDYPLNECRAISKSQKIIALLSQNMNFVIDLKVDEFLELHGKCWNKNMEKEKSKILELANELSGEPFTMNHHVAQLSGGQSRALMIADCALLSSAPIVLIDEIENAGINRRKALDLLISNDKFVFLTTHDPVLALMANKRLVIKNGGISKVINKTKEEDNVLNIIEEMDNKLMKVREELRKGKQLSKATLFDNNL